jgi:hypothetical protein
MLEEAGGEFMASYVRVSHRDPRVTFLNISLSSNATSGSCW